MNRVIHSKQSNWSEVPGHILTNCVKNEDNDDPKSCIWYDDGSCHRLNTRIHNTISSISTMNLFSVIFPVVIVFLTFIVLEVTARLGTGLLPDVVTRFLSDTCPVDAPSNGGGCVSAYQTCEYNETCCSNDASKCINATTCTCLGNVGKAVWSCETVDSSLVGIMCSTSGMNSHLTWFKKYHRLIIIFRRRLSCWYSKWRVLRVIHVSVR
jgi:hypothetical protein